MVKRRENPNQTLFNWSDPAAVAAPPAAAFPDSVKLAARAPAPLVERLPWDFSATFPQPTDEAIDAGVVHETDVLPENLEALHENYTSQCLAALAQLDRVLDARRMGVDPGTGRKPRTHASRERLRRYLAEEPARLEHAFNVLLETYENAFGPEAAHAFNRFLRARHAGVPVELEPHALHAPLPDTTPRPADNPQRAKPRRRVGSSQMPVPSPLVAAVKSGHFGLREDGAPVRPTPEEVRAITEQHAEKIIGLLDGRRQMERSLAAPQCADRARVGSEATRIGNQINAELAKYAASFGEAAAAQMERYVRRQLRER